ncbi:MAG: hypothetical protein FWB77_06185 [Treponema sp.]|nr:hypothetical protein [Treponema sp.]
MDNGSQNNKKGKKFFKGLLIFFIILAVIAAVWIVFSMIGRVNAASVIPDSASVRISISNPVSLTDRILDHESLDDISAIPAFSSAASFINILKENKLLKNRLVRFAARGNMELALLPPVSEFENSILIAVWDLRLLSPLLRIIPAISGLISVPNLYYVQAGSNSRFEFRINNMTLFIGPYRNLLFISDNPKIFESRSAVHSGHNIYSNIKPSSYDAALILSDEFISGIMGELDSGIAELLNNIQFNSRVEAGISVFPRKIEFSLAAPLSSNQPGLKRILDQRSRVPGMADNIPASSQYATILSAGTLNELYQAALIFTPGLGDALTSAENISRTLLGSSLSDILFSWTGNEFAVFGIEGRPHPVYAIQIADERKRDEIFKKAFKSIALNENARLVLDGTRISRIELPEFLQSLLRRWDIFLPSPYYIVHRDCFLASESAEALLAALRAMQRNDVLPKTAAWKGIAGGRTTASAVSLYYSLDVSMPFFLRKNTALGSFISLYRQGLARISFDKSVINVSFSLVPGSGRGVTLVNGYPVRINGRPSNRVYGADNKIFFTSGTASVLYNIADNSVNELANQGNHWIIPVSQSAVNHAAAWIVTDRGRVTLVDNEMDAIQGFPLLTGLRLTAIPKENDGKLYICDENGKVCIIDQNGNQTEWETTFNAALRSPPSFLTVSARRGKTVYAAVYPKSFFGEIWLLDADGKPYSNWPAPIAVSAGDDEDESASGFGIGFGSPLLFLNNNSINAAFVNQSGQLLVYDEYAEIVPPFPLNLDGVFYVQPVFDGEFLWLVSSDGTFFRISLDGEVLYQNIQGFSVMEEGFITVFDSDGDKKPEVYITGEGNALHAYTRNFRSLEGFPLPVWGKPHFISAQGSKKAEIIGMGMDGRLYRWQFK